MPEAQQRLEVWQWLQSGLFRPGASGRSAADAASPAVIARTLPAAKDGLSGSVEPAISRARERTRHPYPPSSSYR